MNGALIFTCENKNYIFCNTIQIPDGISSFSVHMTVIIVSPYNVDAVDYFPVNLELRFQGEPAQDIRALFAVTLRRDDVVEPVEEFYLNVVPIENAIILTPRITVRIPDGKLCVLFIHYTHE